MSYNPPELVALDLNVGIAFDSDKIFVDTFNFLKISDFKTFYIRDEKENPLSWRIRAGIDRYDKDDNALYDYVLDGGLGLVEKFGNTGIFYGFINAFWHSLDQQYRVGPSVGFIVGRDFFKFQTDYGLEFGLEDYGYVETVQTKLQYQVNNQHAVQISFENNTRRRLAVSYFFYW